MMVIEINRSPKQENLFKFKNCFSLNFVVIQK